MGRSPRCSYCHEVGHNVTTCPKKTQRMKEAHDYWIEQGHPDAWAVKQYKERIAPKKRNQTCGYCEERGHTRGARTGGAGSLFR